MRTTGVCILLMLLSFGVARAEVPMPFVEDWEGESAGDNANQLADWSYQSAYGTAPASEAFIVDNAGDNVLNMNPGSSNSMGINSDRALFGGPVLTVESDMLLTTDGDGAGVIGFAEYGAPLQGYVLAVSRNGSNAWFDLRKFDGDLNDSFTVGPVSVAIDPTETHHYMLAATFEEDGDIAFEVYLDYSVTPLSSPNLQPVDNSPHDFTDGAQFVLASNFGQQAYFDNFQALPEPATMSLLALGSLAMLRQRRN